MVDTISAPDHDRCALEGCNRTRAGHIGVLHRFTTAEQLAGANRRPADPLRDVRKMTEEERQRKTETERIFAPTAAERAGRKKKKDEPMEIREDAVVCNYPGCGKPRSNHRGRIGHSYTEDAKSDKVVRAAPPAKKRKYTRKPKPAPRRSLATIDKVSSVLELSAEINILREQLDVKLEKLKELLA